MGDALPLADFAARLRPNDFILPRRCWPRAPPPEAEQRLRAERVAVCGGPASGPLASSLAADCADGRFWRQEEKVSSAERRPRFLKTGRQLFVLDHWLVARPGDADRLVALADDSALFERTTHAVAALAPERAWLTGHFYLGWQPLQGLNASLSFALDEGVDWALARFWAGVGLCAGRAHAHAAVGRARRGNERSEESGFAEGLSLISPGSRVELAEDLALTHAGSALTQPLGLQGSCGGGGDFFCLTGSARCRRAAVSAAAADLMSRPAARAQFLFCAAQPCRHGCARGGGGSSGGGGTSGAGGASEAAREPPYSQHAVGGLLALWLEVTRAQKSGRRGESRGRSGEPLPVQRLHPSRSGEPLPVQRLHPSRSGEPLPVQRLHPSRSSEPPLPRAESDEEGPEDILEEIASGLLREGRAARGEAWSAARAEAACLPQDGRVGWCGQPSSDGASGCARGNSGRWQMAEMKQLGAEALAAACEERCRGCVRCR